MKRKQKTDSSLLCHDPLKQNRYKVLPLFVKTLVQYSLFDYCLVLFDVSVGHPGSRLKCGCRAAAEGFQIPSEPGKTTEASAKPPKGTAQERARYFTN